MSSPPAPEPDLDGDDKPGGEDGGDAGAKTPGILEFLKGGTALVIALAFLLFFIIMVVVMWDKADDAGNETAWARWTFLLAGIEAVAFAGAGWLFGKEVHRGEAEAAKEQAKTAQTAANEQTGRAAGAEARGRALRGAIESKRGGGAQRRSAGGGGTGELDELAGLARQMFP